MLFKKKQEDSQPSPSPAVPRRRRKWLKIVIIMVVVIIAAALILRACLPGREAMDAMSGSAYQYETVQRRDITQSLSYSGTLEPADSYDVTALVTGEILEAPFEEGDVLEEGALLYTIDTDDAQSTIDQAENSLEQAQMSYDRAVENMENLNVTASKSGTVVSLDVEVGDDVQAGQQLGTIRDSSTMELLVPFNSADAAGISVGDAASVTVNGGLETVSGTVSKVSAVEEALSGGMVVRYVTIDVPNPGGIASGAAGSAVIGGVACNSEGTFSYKAEAVITAGVSGEVASIAAPEGSWVEKDALILTLTSSELEDSLRSGELSLENAQENLENYQITSPIAGTVIQKNYKAGDKLSTGTAASGALCTIYDLSYLTMTLSVDELDISSISEGQKVTITADAVEGRTYEGEVTSISVQGTTSGGVTTYPVTIRLDETDGLLPGMNVDAEIVVSSAEQVLAVPTSAVQRGNQVLVSTESETGKAALEAQQAEDSSQPADDSIPEGYIYVEVTLGLSDDNYIEITGGLAEGDEIAYAGAAGSSLTDMFMGGMNMGEMDMGGGAVTIAPSGGMGGGGMGGGMGGR